MQNERQQRFALRREVTVLCLIFMLYFVVSGVYSGLFLRVSDTAASVNADIPLLENLTFSRIMMVAYLGVYFLMFAVPIALFFLIRSKEKTTDYFHINKAPDLVVTLLGCSGVLAVNYFFTIFTDAGDIIFSRLGALSGVMDMLSIGDDVFSNIIYFIILVIAPAFMEEFCFRGIICGRIAKYNRTAAVLISALLFSLMHMTIGQIPFAFCAGLLFGYIYVRTGSVWCGVFIHAVNNGFAFLESLIDYQSGGAISAQRSFMIVFACLFLVGLASLTVLALTHKEGAPQRLGAKYAVGACFSSPVFIIVCVLAILATVLNAPLYA